MKEYQILTKFDKESYTKISEKAEQLGLPKSTLVRFILNKAMRNEL